MYITEVLTKTKKGLVSHRCILLRESFRKDGKINTRTIANLTHCNPGEVAAIRLALQHKDDLTVLQSLKEVELEQGMSVGAAWLVYQVAREIGIETALGKERSGKISALASDGTGNQPGFATLGSAAGTGSCRL